MLKIYNLNELSQSKIEEISSRALTDDKDIEVDVKVILEGVKSDGDEYLKSCNKRFDNYDGDNLYLELNTLQALATEVSEELQIAIKTAISNIKQFHQTQLINEERIETTKGVVCWRENRAIEKVGLYVPGGSAVLPSTFLMLAIPALIAGCKDIVVCTPPNYKGLVNPAIAFCAISLGIDRIYLAGGAQAIGAMAFGTHTIPKVYKIFGPGNRYVNFAKSLVQKWTAIDLPAGPSEVLIIADEFANPDFLAADLLAQAEHGSDSQVVLVSTSSDILDKTNRSIAEQCANLPRKEMALNALKNSFGLLIDRLEDGFCFSNEYAPEHLILAINNPESYTHLIINAGSVFLGNYTPESAGDYASGTNHTLPTAGNAKAYSGVSVDSFLKKITFQKINKEGINNLGNTIEILAEAEGLQAHKNSVTLRLK